MFHGVRLELNQPDLGDHRADRYCFLAHGVGKGFEDMPTLYSGAARPCALRREGCFYAGVKE